MQETAQTHHKAYYEDPIALEAGEEFILSGRRDAWEDNPEHIWLWAIAQDGREGWVPEGFAVVKDDKAIAPYAYFARELNVVAGESLTIVRKMNGWAWCESNTNKTGANKTSSSKTSSSKTGWVPLKIFVPIAQ